MIRPDGYVKVIDFGLAKLVRHRPPMQPSEREVDASRNCISAPRLLYAPEQARGDAIDHRTDLWSLGIILYEMVARRRPFEGDTESHIIVSILDKPVPRLKTDAHCRHGSPRS